MLLRNMITSTMNIHLKMPTFHIVKDFLNAKKMHLRTMMLTMMVVNTNKVVMVMVVVNTIKMMILMMMTTLFRELNYFRNYYQVINLSNHRKDNPYNHKTHLSQQQVLVVRGQVWDQVEDELLVSKLGVDRGRARTVNR